ncbi:MAG: dihydrodipicolinate synthase family protein [Pirellulales bacterium]|nr:dihydrodipicolinate synthase family protein [Pirellulales bacterium]
MEPLAVSLTGVVPIVPTPFTAEEEIDLEALEGLIEFAVECKLSAVCLPAFASEFYKLSDAERETLVHTAIRAAAGRLTIVAQANHPSAAVAARIARKYQQLGASMISFALPRLFSLPEADLVSYAQTICRAVDLPVLVQDFNPGGPTVGRDFACRLADAAANFRYLKLEEALMGGKIRGIIEGTGGRVGVLEGWGGMYMLDLLPAGICGLMPGLGVADVLAQVWHLAHAQQRQAACEVFQQVLPQIVYSLQHSEVFNWVEKRLLVARGALPPHAAYVRRATYTPDDAVLAHADELNGRVVELAARLRG